MTVFLLIAFGVYFLLLIVLIIGWQRQTDQPVSVQSEIRLSVVIPFRNEASVITTLLGDLSQLEYPLDRFEVIMVNDHSTDASETLVRERVRSLTHFRVISLPDSVTGKKRAITVAVGTATGDVILTTDADCRIPSGWLREVGKYFETDSCCMVLGPVRIEGGGVFFSQLQALEFCSLVGVSRATASLGIPTLCNGANLAFRKTAFTEVGGYEGNFSIASGDDEFLMRKIHTRFPGQIRFLTEPQSIVTTWPQETLQEFVRQRQRWAGKWKFNSSVTSRALAVLVLAFQVSCLLLPALFFTGIVAWKVLVVVLLGKVILEFLFLFPVTRYLQVKWRTLHFFMLQFVYPVYVIFIGVTSLFAHPQWKGRKGS